VPDYALGTKGTAPRSSKNDALFNLYETKNYIIVPRTYEGTNPILFIRETYVLVVI
jgi:hypothetical protein